jgi:hypothetical protein
MALIRDVEQAVEEILTEFSPETSDCCLSCLRNNGIWPLAHELSKESLQKIVYRLEQVTSCDLNCNNCECCYGGERPAWQSISIVALLNKAREDIVSIQNGVCLDCFKRLRQNKKRDGCRFCVE